MKFEIIWEMYEREESRHFFGPTDKIDVNTFAQAQKWIAGEVGKREHDSTEVDCVVLSEIGSFTDEHGKPSRTKKLATFHPMEGTWQWAA